MLLIKGESFPCDWEGRNPDGTHTGWAHTNKDAEAVWTGTADDEKLPGRIPKDDQPTDWQQLAKDILSGDDERMLSHLPEHIATAIREDRVAYPDGHPCRSCNKLYREHPHAGCEEWH